MRGIRSLRALSLEVALLGCFVGPLGAQTIPNSKNESAAIHGTVVNSVTHAPIGRALVYSQDNRFATLTDSEGRFEFTVPSNKAQRSDEGPLLGRSDGPIEVTEENLVSMIPLMARKPGFLSDENAQATFVGPDQREVTIYLVPAGLIVGHVTVADSESSQRAPVELLRRQVQNGRATWTSAGTVATWSDGQFRFSDLYPGTYKVFTRESMDRDPLTFDPRGPLYGYPPVYFPGVSKFEAGTAIQLRAGVTFNADLSLQRRRYYPVSVGVANAPEGGVGVQVLAGGQIGPGYSLRYNPRAHAIQGWLPDGVYTVEASYYGNPGASGTAEISVQGAAVTGYTVTLVPNASLRVDVAEELTSTQSPADSGQTGVSGGHTYVRLEPAGEFERRGRFRGAETRQPDAAEDAPLTIENVMPGRYWVRVYSGRGFAAAIKYGDADLLHQPLVVPPGGLNGPIEVTVRDDFAQIDGIIVEKVPAAPVTSANPAAYIYLIPSPDSPGQFEELGVSPNGKFFLPRIPPGDYQVLAFARRQKDLEYQNTEAMRKYESLGQEIRLVPGQTAHLELHLISGSE